MEIEKKILHADKSKERTVWRPGLNEKEIRGRERPLYSTTSPLSKAIDQVLRDTAILHKEGLGTQQKVKKEKPKDCFSWADHRDLYHSISPQGITKRQQHD